MHVFENHNISAGDVVFYPMIADVSQLMALAGDAINDLHIQHLVEHDDACYHGEPHGMRVALILVAEKN